MTSRKMNPVLVIGAAILLVSCSSGGGSGGSGGSGTTPTATTTTLTITKVGGTGTGTVTSNPPGITCGATCSITVAIGTSVTLTGAPDNNMTLAGWDACSGTGPCTVVVSGNTTVNAMFNVSVVNPAITVSMTGAGSGVVACDGGACPTSYPWGTTHTFAAAANPGSFFAGWNGNLCSGTTSPCGPIAVTANPTTVTAIFSAIPVTTSLTVNFSGTGAGSVVCSTNGGTTFGACSASYPGGTMITLQATANTGSTFSGWSGGGCSGTGTCQITLNQNATVQAGFTLNASNLSLSVTPTGTGSGSITCSVNGGATGACSTSYPVGTMLNLTASPNAGSTFSGWSGTGSASGCIGAGACSFVLNATTSVTAVFNKLPVAISTDELPLAVVGRSYTTTLAATGGTGPYSWSLGTGSDPLPSNLALASSTGVISGTPNAESRVRLIIQVTDATAQSATKNLVLSIRPRTERISITSTGTQLIAGGAGEFITPNGRFVLFASGSAEIAGPNAFELFLHDRLLGETTMVSIDSSGNPAEKVNGDVLGASGSAITPDGRFVLFTTAASNLVAGDTNNSSDVFVHDRQTGATTRVSVDSAGNQAQCPTVFGLSCSGGGSISSDGRFVAFISNATNLVPGDTNNAADIFVHDRQTGQTTREDFNTTGITNIFPMVVSADGRYIAFRTLTDVWFRDRQTGQSIVVSNASASNGAVRRLVMTDDGRFLVFNTISALVADDTNNLPDIYVHDRQTGQTSRVSISSSGIQMATVGIFEQISPSTSADGRFVAFAANDTNLIVGDNNNATDIFVRDRQANQTFRVSLTTQGFPSNGSSFDHAMSGDGRFIAFESDANNLVPGDTNGVRDIFVSVVQ